MKITWIGTGVMGAPMAMHLAHAGHEVTVYNRSVAKARALGDPVKITTCLEDAIQGADVIFTMVGFPQDVESVYTRILDVLTSQPIMVDMTTSSPTLAKRLAKKAALKGIDLLDAPVTGGDIGARNATLSIMVGGNASAYESILPLLQKLGTRITYMGEVGSGQYAKLANQIAIAGSIAGVAEALTFAKSHSLDGEAMLNVITGGSAQSWQAVNNGPKMLNADYRPGFFVKHFLKDLKLAVEMSSELDLPVLNTVMKTYEKLNDLGQSESGTQIIFQFYQQFNK